MASKTRLLIVDDEEPLRMIMKDELVQRGFVVGDAASGAEALDALGAAKYDVVILDIRMDEMDGLEVLRQIRAAGIPTKVIMLTGVDELKIARESLALGADDFMTKPFQLQNLLACIERVLKEG